MQRSAGVVLFFASYAVQWLAFRESLRVFNQSLMLIFLIPAIFLFGWTLSGLVLGGLVFNPLNQKHPWRSGFLWALLASVAFVGAVFAYQSTVPKTGGGL